MRVSSETLARLNAFIDSLPEEAKSKCALCNETLTHIVKMAEAQTGAGTRTVCRAIAERHNEEAAPMDKVSDEALTQRVRQKEGLKMSERHNNPSPEPGAAPVVTEAMYLAEIAISQMSRIRPDDPKRREALEYVIDWINENA